MMKTVNSGSKTFSPWTYDRVCKKYQSQPSRVTKIECGIGAFTDLLNDPVAVSHIDPFYRRDILLMGLYAKLEIGQVWLEVWVPKNPKMKLSSLRFV
jgi:hypothetical protein